MRAPKQFGIQTDFDNKPSSTVFLARKRACGRRTSYFKYSSVHWFIGCIGTTSYNHWEKNMGNIYKEVFARVMLLMGNGYEKTLSLPSFNTFICPSLSLGA